MQEKLASVSDHPDYPKLIRSLIVQVSGVDGEDSREDGKKLMFARLGFDLHHGVAC